MEKEFKRVPGDNVWVMYNNKAEICCIQSIFYCSGIDGFDHTSVVGNETYKLVCGSQVIGDYKLEDMFSTKEELIASL